MKILSNLKSILIPQLKQSLKLAIVVRNDIRMSKGKIAAQCAHAAILCYQEAQKTQGDSEILQQWCDAGQPKIILRTDSFTHLENLHQSAKRNGIITALVQDAGRTQLEPGTVTVLGIGPDHEKNINKIVSHLKLL